MCPDCEIEMLEHEILRNMSRIEELKKKKGNNINMKFGYLVMCRADDGFMEPEGTVLFDDINPKIGTQVKLCDGRLWKVVEDNTKNEYNPHIVCEIVKGENE
jgi:hypothetical protein